MLKRQDARQSEIRVLLDQIDSTTVTALDSVITSIDSELVPLGRLIAQAIPSLVVTVGAGQLVNPNTNKNRSIPSVNNVWVAFNGGSITFPSTSGNITPSPGTPVAMTIGASQFVSVLVQLDSSGNIVVFPSTAQSTLSAAITALPLGALTSLTLGYIVVHSNGSSIIQNIDNSQLYQIERQPAFSALSNPMTTIGDTIYGSTNSPGSTPVRLGIGTSVEVLGVSAGVPAWTDLRGNSTVLKAPTSQIFLSGSGTYTTPTGPTPLYLRIRMVGGGGGGGASQSGDGTSGTASTFGTSLLSAGGGTFGLGGNNGGGTGGTSSLGVGPIGIALTGGDACGGQSVASSTGSAGASSAFGGSGASTAGLSGTNGKTNTGGGGGGGSQIGTAGGGGGGSGGYVDAVIYSPSATYSYVVGSGGTGGSNTGNGGNGGSGIIIVEEHYQ